MLVHTHTFGVGDTWIFYPLMAMLINHGSGKRDLANNSNINRAKFEYWGESSLASLGEKSKCSVNLA